MSSINGREPYSLDIADLGRRAGAMMRVSRTSPAFEDLSNAMIGVPEGSDVELDLMAESVIEGVLVSGTAMVTLDGSCGRCLDPVQDTLTVDLQELFRYEMHDHATAGSTATAGCADEELSVLRGEIIDLKPTIRDAVVLALPLTPVCREECQGLCSECGVLLAQDPKHYHEQTDPRPRALFGALTQDNQSFTDRNTNQTTDD